MPHMTTPIFRRGDLGFAFCALLPMNSLRGMSVQRIEEERAEAVHVCRWNTVFLGKSLAGVIVGLPHDEQVSPVSVALASVRLEIGEVGGNIRQLAEIGGARSEGEKLNTIDGVGISAEPGGEIDLAAPDD